MSGFAIGFLTAMAMALITAVLAPEPWRVLFGMLIGFVMGEVIGASLSAIRGRGDFR